MCNVFAFYEVTVIVSHCIESESPNPDVYSDVHRLKLSFKTNKNDIFPF